MKKNFGEVLSNFENIMENGAFALKDSIFCKIFQIVHDISKVSKDVIME